MYKQLSKWWVLPFILCFMNNTCLALNTPLGEVKNYYKATYPDNSKSSYFTFAFAPPYNPPSSQQAILASADKNFQATSSTQSPNIAIAETIVNSAQQTQTATTQSSATHTGNHLNVADLTYFNQLAEISHPNPDDQYSTFRRFRSFILIALSILRLHEHITDGWSNDMTVVIDENSSTQLILNLTINQQNFVLAFNSFMQYVTIQIHIPGTNSPIIVDINTSIAIEENNQPNPSVITTGQQTAIASTLVDHVIIWAALIVSGERSAYRK